MDLVNEKTSWTVTASFYDEGGNAVTPDSGSYRIDDVGSDTEITGDTPFIPAGSTHDINITPTENRILTTSNQVERRRVTVTFSYGVGKQGSGEYYYGVKNLAKVS